MKDSSALVKDTAAWTIGRICHLLPDVVGEKILDRLMVTLLGGLKDTPKVASNVCWAIHNLASAVEVEDDAKTSPMSKYFEGLVRALLATTQRSDVYEANLMMSAYEAINELIRSAAPDQYTLIGQLIPELMKLLKATLQTGLTGQDREKQNEVQALLCGAIQTVIQKVQKSVAIQYADAMMMMFLQVLVSKNHATVHEEALMAVGSIANLTEKEFNKYMSAFSQFLIQGLKNYQEVHVCSVAVGVVGDVARALEEKLVPHCDDIMQLLLSNLQNPGVDRLIKPQIISCLGDIALSVGGHFERYLPYAMMMLMQASQTKMENMNDADNMEYLETLRESVLDAYTGILQGLSSDPKKASLFAPSVENVMSFIDVVAKDTNRPETVTRAAVGLIGDIASRLGAPIAQHIRRPAVNALILAAIDTDKESELTNDAGEYAKKAVAPFIQS